MARRRIFWHVGPEDLGTAWLADALDAAREDLEAQGVLVPGPPASWELATVELRRNHQQLGHRRGEVEGQNAALVRRMWKHKGTSVISTPGLASATPDQVVLALDGLRGAEIHLVLVVRDLTSQVHAAAQVALEQGATTDPERYAARVLDPAEEHPQAVAWRAGHDLPDVLRRWARTVHPEHVHVLALDDPVATWAALTGLLGVDVALPDVAPAPVLGTAQLRVLRDVALALDDRLDRRARRTALRDWLSRDLLALQPGAPLPVVDGGDTTTTWADHIARKGFDVHGTFATAPDPLPEGTGPDPDASAAAALADAVVEVARLQRLNAALAEENLRLDRKRRKHRKRARDLERQQVA